MGQIYLVRHGQASFGTPDYDVLSRTGVEQSRLLGKWFADCGLPLTRALVGTLRRHTQTAESFFAGFGESAEIQGRWQVEPDFDEYDQRELLIRYDPAFEQQPVGALGASGQGSLREFQAHFSRAFDRWVSGHREADYQATWPAFRARCVEAVTRLAERLDRGESAIVFTSGGPISALCQHLLGVPDERVGQLQWQLVNSSVTRLRYRPGQISLASFNSIAHLERAAAASLITYR